MDYTLVLVLVGSGIFWARAASAEDASPVVWVSLSVAANFGALWLTDSLGFMLLSQVLLFFGITVYRARQGDR